MTSFLRTMGFVRPCNWRELHKRDKINLAQATKITYSDSLLSSYLHQEPQATLDALEPDYLSQQQ